MRTSFVGLVSRFGLELLLPECAASRSCLQQAATARKAACIWAVLEQNVASEIAHLLATDERWTALHRLSYGADCVGPLDESCASGGEWLT